MDWVAGFIIRPAADESRFADGTGHIEEVDDEQQFGNLDTIRSSSFSVAPFAFSAEAAGTKLI